VRNPRRDDAVRFPGGKRVHFPRREDAVRCPRRDAAVRISEERRGAFSPEGRCGCVCPRRDSAVRISEERRGAFPRREARCIFPGGKMRLRMSPKGLRSANLRRETRCDSPEGSAGAFPRREMRAKSPRRSRGGRPKVPDGLPKRPGECSRTLGGGVSICGLGSRSSPCTVSRASSPGGLHRARASPVNARKRSVKRSDRRHAEMPVKSFRVPVAGCLVRPLSFRRSSIVSGLYQVAQHVGHLELNQEAWLLFARASSLEL
jgi:hypothetical protein